MGDGQNQKKRGPTNGETNGDDADIYGKAAAESAIRLAVTSSLAVKQFAKAVEASREAVGVLQTVRQTTESKDCSDRLTEALNNTAVEALKLAEQLIPLLREARTLLSRFDTPEGRACCENLGASIDNFDDKLSGSPRKP